MVVSKKKKTDLRCVQGLNLWRNNSKEVNDVIFKGYKKGNPEGKPNEIAAGCCCYSTSLSFMFFDYAHKTSDSSCLLSCLP